MAGLADAIKSVYGKQKYVNYNGKVYAAKFSDADAKKYGVDVNAWNNATDNLDDLTKDNFNGGWGPTKSTTFLPATLPNTPTLPSTTVLPKPQPNNLPPSFNTLWNARINGMTRGNTRGYGNTAPLNYVTYNSRTYFLDGTYYNLNTKQRGKYNISRLNNRYVFHLHKLGGKLI